MNGKMTESNLVARLEEKEKRVSGRVRENKADGKGNN